MLLLIQLGRVPEETTFQYCFGNINTDSVLILVQLVSLSDHPATPIVLSFPFFMKSHREIRGVFFLFLQYLIL